MLMVMTICVRVCVHIYESVSILYESEFIGMSLHVRMHLSETVCMYESAVCSVIILGVNRQKSLTQSQHIRKLITDKSKLFMCCF